MQHSYLDVVQELGEPYTFRKMRKLRFWCFSDAFGDEYEIMYEGQVIRTITDSYQNVKDIVKLLNIAYQVGIADTLSLVNGAEESVPKSPAPLTLVK
jgi:hypothetical protein